MGLGQRECLRACDLAPPGVFGIARRVVGSRLAASGIHFRISFVSNQRLLVTTHRPFANLELLQHFGERYGPYGVHAFSSANAWPANQAGTLNHAVLDRQPPGLTCWIVDNPGVADLVTKLRQVQPSAIFHAPFLGLPASASPVKEYQAAVNDTLTWLEAVRQACPHVPFVHLSSTLVYGDRSNTIAMDQRGDRFEFTDPFFAEGLGEAFPIEGSTHSLLGAAAVAADVLAQEYARSYHLPVCCLRVDSICDPGNGFEDRRDVLSQIARCCLAGTEFIVHGLDGRQVREVLSIRDLSTLVELLIENPRPGEIYNVGGGRPGSCSIREMMDSVESISGKTLRRGYRKAAQLGEPTCHYSDPRHLRDHFPQWEMSEPWKMLARRVVETQAGQLAR